MTQRKMPEFTARELRLIHRAVKNMPWVFQSFADETRAVCDKLDGYFREGDREHLSPRLT